MRRNRRFRAHTTRHRTVRAERLEDRLALTTWWYPSLGERLVPNDAQRLDQFGTDVAIDANLMIVNSLPTTDTLTPPRLGGAYVYKQIGGSWVEQTKLSGSDLRDDATDSDSVHPSLFGLSVAISGNTAVVGAPGVNTAYVFQQSGTDWIEQAKLQPADGGETFGWAVDIDGDTTPAR